MNRLIPIILFLLVAMTTAGCDFVGDVLEFGLWLVLIGIVVIVLIAFAIFKAFFD